MKNIVSVILGSGSKNSKYLTNKYLNFSDHNIFLFNGKVKTEDKEIFETNFNGKKNVYLPDLDSHSSELVSILKSANFESLQIVNFTKCKAVRKSFNDLTVEDWLNSFNSNLLPLINIMKLFSSNNIFGDIIKQTSVVNFSSFLALYGTKDLIPYASAKSALINITASLSAVFKEKNVRLNVISFGNLSYTTTKIESNHKNESHDLISILELFDVLRFLLSNKSSAINGKNLVVDTEISGTIKRVIE